MASISRGIMMEINTIVVGDCLDVMGDMPDGCVQMVVTSPPYWGLRDYGHPPQIWGGEVGCGHEWDTIIKHRTAGGPQVPQTKWQNNESVVMAQRDTESDVCRLCGAWRGCLGLEPTPELYVSHLVDIFREVKRVLRDDGTLWLNLGDSYANDSKWGGSTGGKHVVALHGKAGPGRSKRRTGLKNKDLVGIPWRVAFALQADGWWLRSDIIWHKPNCMPESVRDRPTTSHEHLFLLAKSKRYFYDQDAIREPLGDSGWQRQRDRGKGVAVYGEGHDSDKTLRNDAGRVFSGNPAGRNKRTVWTIPTKPYSGAHFAVFPEALIEPCIKAGTSERGACPECGTGWARVVEKGNQEPQREGGEKTNRLSPRCDGTGSGGYYPTSRTLGWRPTCTCYNTDPLPKCPKRGKKETDEGHAERSIAPIRVERLRLLKEWEALATQPSLVFDPFMGAGTTALVALKLGRAYYGAEINPEYVRLAEERLAEVQLRLL